MGGALANTSHELIEGISSFVDDAVVDSLYRRIAIPFRTVPEERWHEVDRILCNHTGPKWLAGETACVDPVWFRAASTKSIEYCKRRMTEFLYEIQVFRIGDAAFVALPGEPFVEGQLEIKRLSPAERTCVAHMCSQYVGYIPTKNAADNFGHEADESYPYWAKLSPEALNIIVRNAVEMLQVLFAPE